MSCIGKYVNYLLHSKHRKGFGIHSPFMFYMVTNVIEEKLPYYRFFQIENLRKLLLKSKRVVMVDFPGGKEKRRMTVGKITYAETISKEYDQLLFRWVNYFKPRNVVEIGDSIGVTTLYLSTPDTRRKVYSISKTPFIAQWANQLYGKLQLKNINVILGNTKDGLEIVKSEQKVVDFVYFNRSSTVEDIKETMSSLSPMMSGDTVLLMADIYSTPEKEMQWKELKKTEGVKVSLELFHYGMLIFREELQEEEYNLFYFPSLYTVRRIL